MRKLAKVVPDSMSAYYAGQGIEVSSIRVALEPLKGGSFKGVARGVADGNPFEIEIAVEYDGKNVRWSTVD